jgi:hypothetical protein
MNFMGSDDPKDMAQDQYSGQMVNFLPVKNLYIPVDKKLVLQNGTVPMKDSAKVLPEVDFTIQKNSLYKNDLLLLDILAANDWKRPIYFTSPFQHDEFGLNDFLEANGLTYRLVPVKADNNGKSMAAIGNVNADGMYAPMMHKFGFGGANLHGTYFDETNRSMLLNIRNAYAREGEALAMENKKDSALNILNLCDKMMLQSNFPYGLTSPGNTHDISSMQTVYAYYSAGDTGKAESVAHDIIRDCQQQIIYYNALPQNKLTSDLQDDQQRAQLIIQQLQKWHELFTGKSNSSELPASIRDTSGIIKQTK